MKTEKPDNKEEIKQIIFWIVVGLILAAVAPTGSITSPYANF